MQFTHCTTNAPICAPARIGLTTGMQPTHPDYRAIRTRDHKLIENYNDLFELYDLQADPHEGTNIASVNPTLIRELHQLMLGRFIRPMIIDF